LQEILNGGYGKYQLSGGITGTCPFFSAYPKCEQFSRLLQKIFIGETGF
jgi:hypothetical protein